MKIFEPITVAWEPPRPGRKEQRGETAKQEIAGSKKSFLFIFSEEISCEGICVFWFIEISIEDVPYSPVSNGRSDWFIFKFKEDIPRKPASIKIKKDINLFFES